MPQPTDAQSTTAAAKRGPSDLLEQRVFLTLKGRFAGQLIRLQRAYDQLEPQTQAELVMYLQLLARGASREAARLTETRQSSGQPSIQLA